MTSEVIEQCSMILRPYVNACSVNKRGLGLLPFTTLGIFGKRMVEFREGRHVDKTGPEWNLNCFKTEKIGTLKHLKRRLTGLFIRFREACFVPTDSRQFRWLTTNTCANCLEVKAHCHNWNRSVDTWRVLPIIRPHIIGDIGNVLPAGDILWDLRVSFARLHTEFSAPFWLCRWKENEIAGFFRSSADSLYVKSRSCPSRWQLAV